MSPFQVLASCFLVSSIAGLATFLKSRQRVSFRAVVGTLLHTGMMGLIIGFLWFNEYGKDNPYFMLGVAGLAGIGGVTVVDLVTMVWKKSGISFRIVKADQNEEQP